MKIIVPANGAHGSTFNPNKGPAAKKRIGSPEAYYDPFESGADLITDENEADFQHIKLSIKEAADRRIDQYNARRATTFCAGNMAMLPLNTPDDTQLNFNT